MSHYTVLIVGEDVDSALESFSEHLEVEHIISKEELIAKEKKNLDYYRKIDAEYKEDPAAYEEKSRHQGHIDFINGVMQDMLFKWDDDDWHKHSIRYYEESEINDDGTVTSFYNPKSKWDWYVIGGRWSDSIKLKKDATSGVLGERRWGMEEGHKRGFTDSALKQDVAWDHESMKDFHAFAFLDKDGTWYEEGEMGWFGSSTVEDEDWVNSFNRLLDEVNGEDRITIVDCHI